MKSESGCAISFITFGGSEVGTGHLYRCLAISEWACKIFEYVKISFYLYGCDEQSFNISQEIIRSQCQYNVYNYNDCCFEPEKWDVVIVDLLNAPLSLMSVLNKSSCSVVSIDNTSDSRCLSDIAINPLYYQLDNACGKNVKHDLIGPENQIISPRFYKKKYMDKGDSVENILIIQGGADPQNLTKFIYYDLLNILDEFKHIKLHVIIGPAAKETIQVFNNKHADRIFIHSFVKDMDTFLSNMSIAVSSIGITAFELARMEVPAIHVTAIEKELETGLFLEKLGVSILLGKYNSLESGVLYNEISRLVKDSLTRREMKNSCRKFFNREKVERVVKLIFQDR